MQVLNFLFFLQAEAPASLPSAPEPGGAGAGGGLSVFFIFVYLLVCVGLIVFTLIQTTKSEGLSGVIGGASQSIFRGKKSVEEKISQWNTYLAVSFIILSIIIALFTYR